MLRLCEVGWLVFCDGVFDVTINAYLSYIIMAHFTDRLATAARERGNPAMVGLDPRWDLLPKSFTAPVADDDLAGKAEGYRRFCCDLIDVVAPLVPVVKPQVAFFEELGPAGMTALAEVIQHAIGSELLVVLDGKRNDIGSTAEAYARGALGRGQLSSWGADALTVSPYLGEDSLRPFVETAIEKDAGVFVLVKTSNPGGGMIQDLLADQQPVYRHVAQLVERWADETRGQLGYGLVGAVVGATYPDQLAELRSAMPQTWLLVPGFGSQGGTAQDVAPAFDQQGLGAVVNSSRGIIFAHLREEYAERFGDSGWQQAVEAATREMIAELRAETPAGNLG